MRLKSLGWVVVFALACACSSSTKSPGLPAADNTRSAAQALMRSVTLSGGSVKSGDLPDASNDRVTLAPAANANAAPGKATIMSLDVVDPDADQNPVKAVLMQFDTASDHLEAPVDASQSGPGDLNFELLVGDDTCNDLCNRKFTVTLEMALAMDDGSVSTHANTDVTLDCTKKGDAARCTSTAGSGQPAKGTSDAGKKNTKPGDDAGRTGTGSQDRDAGVDASGSLSDGGLGFDAAGLFGDGGFPFDAAGLFGDGGFPFDASAFDRDASIGDGSTNIPCPSGDGSVSYDKLCDGKKDCSDGFDEMVCAPCADDAGTFSPFQRCDGKKTCSDGSDELGCDFTCQNGQHVPTTKFCDGTDDCGDNSDETPCQFPCGDGTYVTATKVCDGHTDCANGADEAKTMCP